MAGRGNGNTAFFTELTTTLQGMNENLFMLNQQAQLNQPQGLPQYRGLDEFCRRNPPQFAGGFAPDAANDWVEELERIFGGMMCTDEQKVAYATYMLTKEAAAWWSNTKQLMEVGQQEVNWANFKERFLGKYFPEDMKVKKEMEFLKLEQGNLSVGEYAAKFEELSKYAPRYNEAGNERSKCAKFEDGLRHELKVMFVHQEIREFAVLVNKCRLYEESVKARNAANRSLVPTRNHGPMRHFDQDREKGRGSHRNNSGPYHSGGRNDNNNRFNGSRFPTNYNNNNDDNNNNANPNLSVNNSGGGSTPPLCNRCNKNHFGTFCGKCYRCNEVGHTSVECPRPKKEEVNTVRASRPEGKGKVFTMSGIEAGTAVADELV